MVQLARNGGRNTWRKLSLAFFRQLFWPILTFNQNNCNLFGITIETVHPDMCSCSGYDKHDCSPIPVFFLPLVPQDIDPYKQKNKMRLNVCVNEMTLYGPYAAVVEGKHSLTAMTRKEVYPRDEIANTPRTTVLPIDSHGFAEGFVAFRTLCRVQSSLVRFAPNRTIVWGPPQWQAP